ncbi:MAG: CHAT domain-containing protein [Betaproteobacteria bacterium]|nr:CHAT domain-containing protein [Betaproteobacteria bacterium]
MIGLSQTRYNMAMLYYMAGEQTRALALLETNLAIVEKLRAEAPVMAGIGESLAATILHGMAAVYDLIGEHARALSLLEKSLAIFEKRGSRDRAVARSLESMARQYWAMGEYSKALPLYQKSRSIYEQKFGPEAAPLANVLQNLAVLYQDMGEYATALPLYERSLSMTEKGAGPDHPAVAFILNNLAGLYLAAGEHQKAVPLLQRALKIASDKNISETLWRVQNGLRLILSREGRSDLAIFFGKQAVNTIQSLRARLITLDPGLQRSFLGNKTDVYRGLADVLIDQGRLPEAQQVMAMLKEEEFFDFIRRDAKSDPRTTQTALTAQEAAWQKRYAEVSGRLAALGTEREELRRKARLGLSEAEQARRTQVEADLRVARLAFDQFLGALMKEVAQAGAGRAAEVGERGLANLRALQGTLASLGHGAVTLHYLMGEEKLRILLTTPSVQIAREAKVGQRELNRKIEQFRRVLQNPRSNALPVAQELYSLLIGPVAEDLRQAKAQTLMISLDGALRYIPLAALHDGKGYMVESYRLAIFTEAAKDKLKDTPQASWRLVGLGLTRQVEGFSPLPAVRQELEGIIRAGDRGVLPGEVHFDEAFTAGRMRDALDKAYPVLHVASHFVFQPGTESNSFLLLGDGSRLTLREMKENDFDFRNVDLITLSACDTAVGGGRDANGQEIEGFGALAQRQGARGVIATLWPVADASTGLLMQNLYRVREQQNLTKAEALRQAQIAFIRGGQATGASVAERGAVRADTRAAGTTSADSSRPYAHPYYWAPFILMGNWL